MESHQEGPSTSGAEKAGTLEEVSIPTRLVRDEVSMGKRIGPRYFPVRKHGKRWERGEDLPSGQLGLEREGCRRRRLR